MSVVGVDFGSLHSKIGVARKRGVDIITNEVSNRATPSLVAFGIKQRSLGESAKTQEISNFRNTVGSLKRLLGRTSTDPEVQEVEKKFLTATLVDVDGTVGAQVTFAGEKQTYSATQLVAMYLGKLRDIASAELKIAVSDIVISIPGWYTEVQRRAILDASAIAGLNPLRLVTDYAAVALGYGITKSDLPEAENPRNVMFIDVGHAQMTVSVIAFSKGQFVVKSAAFERNLGGRDIDYALVQHFAEQFKTKYKIDVLSNPKAMFRLQAACEKLKKILSANSEAPLNVESIMNDVDASSKLSRDEYEGLIEAVLARIPAPIEEALRESGLTLEQLDTIELVGGSTRVPAVRARIGSALPGKILSSTLNQDEACARGATFACAMLSPVFRVREFEMHDVNQYPIAVRWDPVPTDPGDTELLAFPRGNAIPSTKVLTFYRKDSFDLEASYADPKGLPGAINPWIARFTAKAFEVEGDVATVKVKARLTRNGVMSFEGAYVETIEEKEEPAMEVDGAEPAPPKKKTIKKKKEIPFVTGGLGLEKSTLEKYKELEGQLHGNDKLVMDTEERKNALEEYVYDMRGKVDDRYAPFVQPQEKEKLLAGLQECEDWLYTEEGEDALKSAYVTRLDGVKVIGDPIVARYRESEERPKNLSSLRETINSYIAQATSGDEKYAHIDQKDLHSIVEKCATVQKWLEDQVARQAERPKNQDPVVTGAEMMKKRDDIIYFSTPILNKPKPKPAPEPAKTDAPKEEKKDEPKAPEAAPPPEPEGPSEMDVD